MDLEAIGKPINTPALGVQTPLTGYPPLGEGEEVQVCKRIAVLQKATPTLADRTLDALRGNFTRMSHLPSEEMWQALRVVADRFQAMAEGTASSDIYVSSLDPGVGKTQTVIQFLRELLRSPDHAGVSALICVGRLDQIDTMVEEAHLSHTDFAVFTSDKERNARGSEPSAARILFTTHSMVESRALSGRSFADLNEFHYRDHPREVRIWDEAVLPGQTVTVLRDDLGGLFKPFRAVMPALAADLEALFARLGETPDGEALVLPDLPDRHRVDLNAALGAVENGTSEQRSAVQSLWFLFGRAVTVRRDGVHGQTMLDYRDVLPADIAPLVVLDASARVRTTYQFWERHRGGISRLPAAIKRYDPLTIHVWEEAGSKSAFRRQGYRLVDGIAATIDTKPNEEWLVVFHKSGIGMEFESELTARLTYDPARVHYLHWGAHDGTNRFAHVPNIILAGTLFYRPSHYEALGRLAAGKPSSQGPFATPDFQSLMLGEHRHLVLQALCRGAVRRCVGELCPNANAYIIASARSGIPQSLPEIFPGARVVPWRPVAQPLSGKVAKAVAYIADRLSAEPGAAVRFEEVMDHIQIHDRSNFRRTIRQHADFQRGIADHGIVEWRKGPQPGGFKRAVEVFFPADALAA